MVGCRRRFWIMVRGCLASLGVKARGSMRSAVMARLARCHSTASLCPAAPAAGRLQMVQGHKITQGRPNLPYLCTRRALNPFHLLARVCGAGEAGPPEVLPRNFLPTAIAPRGLGLVPDPTRRQIVAISQTRGCSLHIHSDVLLCARSCRGDMCTLVARSPAWALRGSPACDRTRRGARAGCRATRSSALMGCPRWASRRVGRPGVGTFLGSGAPPCSRPLGLPHAGAPNPARPAWSASRRAPPRG